MEENEKKAFDFAADTTKQLITIATAVIALMVTFSKDILGNTETAPKPLLMWTWGFFIISIIFGVLTLMALTGTLQPRISTTPSVPVAPAANVSTGSSVPNNAPNSTNSNNININNGNIRVLSIIQALSFCIAIILTGWYGYQSLINQNVKNHPTHTYQVIRQSVLNGDTSKKYTDTLYLQK